MTTTEQEQETRLAILHDQLKRKVRERAKKIRRYHQGDQQ